MDRRDTENRNRREKFHSQARSLPHVQRTQGSWVGRTREYMGCCVGRCMAGRAVGVVGKAYPLSVGEERGAVARTELGH